MAVAQNTTLLRLNRGQVALGFIVRLCTSPEIARLAQVCDHLTYFMQGSLDGFTFRVPWLLKVLFGRFMLRRILKQRRMKAGIPTPQKPPPPAGGDEAAAVAQFRQVVERFQAHQGELRPSPFFGHLTPQQWRDLHLIHCAHHLGFLAPKPGPA